MQIVYLYTRTCIYIHVIELSEEMRYTYNPTSMQLQSREQRRAAKMCAGRRCEGNKLLA